MYPAAQPLWTIQCHVMQNPQIRKDERMGAFVQIIGFENRVMHSIRFGIRTDLVVVEIERTQVNINNSLATTIWVGGRGAAGATPQRGHQRTRWK